MKFRDLPIRQKLLLMTLTSTAAAVALVSGGFLAWDTNRFRENAIEELAGQAKLVAENASSAVAFADPVVATETLNTLRTRPRIVAGCVYADEDLFASYEKDGRCETTVPPPVNNWARVGVRERVLSGSDQVGWLYVE